MNRLAVLSVLVACLAACGQRTSESLDQALGESVYGEAIPVETLKLVPQSFEERFDASGVVEAEEEVTVSAEVAERIVAVRREIGDRVRRGDLLVSVDKSAIQARVKKIEAQLARATTQLEWARKDLARQERLFRTEIAAERALDEATRLVDTSEDDVAAAQAELELALVDLERCDIRSPIDGSIARRHVSVGEYVTPGLKLYDVVATDQVKFVFSLAERDVIAVRQGEALDVEIDAHPGRTYTGTIRALSPAGSRQTRTFRVEVAVANDPSHPLLPGMSGKAQVVRARFENVFLLPEEAILRDGSSSYVYLANDAHARRADIEILSQVGAKAVIAGEFERDYDCIIVGQAAVGSGSPIRVRRTHEEIPEVRFD